jgi:hypothetical protein
MTAWTSLTDTSAVRTYREVPASRRLLVELRGLEPRIIPAETALSCGECLMTLLRHLSVSCGYASLCCAT